jgi:hypothetical protein
VARPEPRGLDRPEPVDVDAVGDDLDARADPELAQVVAGGRA